MTKYKRGMVSPFSLFAIMYISRILVVFTVSNSYISGEYTSDLIISAIIGLILTLLTSIPILYCSKKELFFNSKFSSNIYSLYFIYICAINVSTFSFFACSELDKNAKTFFFSALIIIACAYASFLGIEAISRFASFVLFIVLIGIFSIVILSGGEFSLLNLFPFTINNEKNILYNSLIFLSDTSEILLLPVLKEKINGKIFKPFYFAIVLSFITTIFMLFSAICSLGDAARLSTYPLFAMAQISTFDTFERLDSIYIAFWIFSAFLKTSVYIYCASILLKCKNKTTFKNKNIFCSIIIFLISLFLTSNNVFEKDESFAIIIPFIIFALIIPIFNIIKFKMKGKS